MKNRSDAEALRAHKVLFDFELLIKTGAQPLFHCMDNEVSTAVKKCIANLGVNCQLTLASMHRRNVAERAIRTCKNHRLAGSSTCDPRFPLCLWCQLIPQCNITLNLLHNSRTKTNLSACAQIFGQFDFNRTPLAPPGTKVLIHEPAETRHSWDNHGL